MPLFLLANWKWLIGAVGVAVLGAMLGLSHLKIGRLERAAAETALAIQVQKTEAQKILADALSHARDIESQNAALNIQLEKDHADAQKKIDHDAGVNRVLAARVGELLNAATRRGTCSSNSMPRESSPSSGGPSDAASSGLSGAFSRFVNRTTELFVEADGVADVGIQCHGFAIDAK